MGLLHCGKKIDNTRDSLNGEINTGLAGLRGQLDEAEGSLKSYQARQQQIVIEIQTVHERHESNLEEETRQRCVGTREVSERIAKTTSQIEATCETLRNEFVREYKSIQTEMERLLSEQDTGSQHVKDLMSTMKVDNDRLKREINQHIDEIRSDFADERNSRLRLAEEERGVFKKLHEEHGRCLDLERDTRLRQVTELRADFVKALTKERETRVVDLSEHRSETSKVAREWQTLKNKLATQSPLSSPLSSPTIPFAFPQGHPIKSTLCQA